jgi:hypothetical protein
MTDTKKLSQIKNAVYMDGVDPKWELNADEICFPLQLDQGGLQVIAYFHVDAQYRATELRTFLDDLTFRYRDSDSGDRDIEFGDETAAKDFVRKHFRSISGVDGNPTREQCVAWLDENPNVLSLIWSQGYSRIIPDDSDEMGGKLVIGSFQSQSVKHRRILYSPQTQSVHPIQIKHVLKRETEADRITHRKAMRQTEKGKVSFFRFNWDVISGLYDRLIQGVEGVVVDGKPASVEDIIRLMPLPDKVAVIGKIFARTAVKNG